MAEWPFDHARNCDAVTNKEILEEKNTIFVGIEGIVKLDSTVKDMGHIEPGRNYWQEYIGPAI